MGGITLSKLPAIAATLTLLGSCTTAGFSSPDRNPSPQAKLVIVGTKDPGTEVHFRFSFSTHNPECEEKRLMEGSFPKIREDTVTARAGSAEFTVEYFLDKYLAGNCDWRPITIDMAANFPPQEFPAWLFSSWGEIALIGGHVGEPDDLAFRCKRRAPGKRTLWCEGGDAMGNRTLVAESAGQLRVTLVLEDGI